MPQPPQNAVTPAAAVIALPWLLLLTKEQLFDCVGNNGTELCFSLSNVENRNAKNPFYEQIIILINLQLDLQIS